MNATLLMRPVMLAAWLLPVSLSAKEPLQLEYRSIPDPFAEQPTWKREEKSLLFPPEKSTPDAGAACSQGYCLRKNTDSGLITPRRIHRTDRKRQSDAFSTNQNGEGGIYHFGNR